MPNWSKFIASFVALIATTEVLAAPIKSNRYAQAKKEMPEETYLAYRLLERLMQTNKVKSSIAIATRSASAESCNEIIGNNQVCSVIADLPEVKPKDSMIGWAVQIISSTKGLPNANADGGGLITIYKSLLNRLSGKPEAIACVIAHEMAHITQNHTKKKVTKYNELDAIAAPKIESAIKNAHSAQKNDQIWTALAYGMNAFSSGLNSGMGNTALANQAALDNYYLMQSLQFEAAGGANEFQRYILQNISVLRLSAPKSLSALTALEGLGETYVKRTKKDLDEYIHDFKIESSRYSRELEKEADGIGVQFVANAGINPGKCLDVIDAIHVETGDATTNPLDSHPGEDERRMHMEKAIRELPPALKNKHKMQMQTLPLLPYEYDKNTQVVRLMPYGTSGMKAGKNTKASSVDSLLGN